MRLIWLGYLIYSLGNCIMKLCIETGLRLSLSVESIYLPYTNLPY